MLIIAVNNQQVSAILAQLADRMDDPDAGTLSHDDEATVLEILNDYFHTL